MRALCITLFIVLFVRGQLNVTWNECPIFNSLGYKDILFNAKSKDVISKCGTAAYPYDYSEHEYFSNTIKAYLSPSPGVSGEGIETIGFQLFKILNGTHSVYMPSIRGSTSASLVDPYSCTDYEFLDHIPSSCSAKNTSWISVDNMAQDLISFTNQIRRDQPNIPITLYGRSFGSYIANRALSIDSTICDSLVFESAWGPHTNASEWDSNRDIVASKILGIFDNNTLPEYKKNTDTPALNAYSNFLIAQFDYFCGHPQESMYDLKYMSLASLFDETLRPKFLGLLSLIDKCDYNSYGNLLSYIPTSQDSLFSAYVKKTTLMNTGVVTNNVLISELIDINKASSVFKNKISSQSTNYAIGKLIGSGWTISAQSKYRYQAAVNFSGPVLILNGDLDPRSSTSSAKWFSSQFNNSRIFIMPQTMSDCVSYSLYDGDLNTTCGANIIKQFIGCNNCTINSSCIASMRGMNFKGNALTQFLFKDSVWNSYYIAPNVSSIVISVVFCCNFIFVCVVTICLIVLRKYRRVTSRGFVPYFGLLFVVIFSADLTILLAAQNVRISDLIGVMHSVSYSVLLCFCYAILVQSVRYYLLRVMYRQMSNTRNRNMIARLMANQFVFVISSIVLFSTSVIYALAIYYADGLRYTGLSFTIVKYSFFAACGILGLLAAIMAVFDFISELILNKGNLRKVLIINDPLHFRADAIILIPIIPSGIFGYLYRFQTYHVLLEMFFLLVIMYSGGTVVISCVVDYFMSRYGKQTILVSDDDFTGDNTKLRDAILTQEGAVDIFRKYCINEFSLENLLGLQELQILISMEEVSDERMKIFEQEFIDRNAPMQLNVPSDVFKLFVAALQPNSTQEHRKTALKKVQDITLMNVMDTFERFKNTNGYKEAVNIIKSENSIKRNVGIE
ncbi:hypothetical protein AKO1_004376 [Acrasis kona]|uniref:RGS domain-containing protein n=1 Tax=Acrasis kona TaxID=1008807 RepID=A0AAW2Z794_9EUKA